MEDHSISHAVSTGERKRKSDGKEYETPPPLPCTPKELDVLLDNGLQMGSSSPTKFPRNLSKRSRETYISAVCTIMCNTLSQNFERFVDWYIEESKEEFSSYLSHKFKETCSRITREKEW